MTTKLSRFWRIASIALLVLVLLFIARVSLITGLVRTVRVQSGSMAEYLLGPHTTATCPECGYEFRWGRENALVDTATVCPNCGYAGAMRATVEHAGDRVLIDRGPLVWGRPQRWQVVALHGPTEAEPLVTKRIVGLPGEQLAIEHGEILVDGDLVRKPLSLLRELAVPVYDDRFRLGVNAARDLPDLRWRPDDGVTDWRITESGYRFTPSAAEPAEPKTADELVYHHWPCIGPPSQRGHEGCVVDLDPYNQGLSRGLNEVGDLYLRFRLHASENAILTVQFQDGAVTVPVIFDFEYYTVRAAADNEGVLQEAAVPRSMTARESLVEVALCDSQVFVAVEGRELINAAYQRSAERKQSPTPVRFRAENGGVELRDLELLRDIYYLCPDGTGRTWTRPTPLGPTEYFLLGDNSPLSDDSRTWPDGGAIERSEILGVVRKR